MIAFLIFCVSLAGWGWAQGWFDCTMEEVWEWEPGKVTPTAHWIEPSGMPDGNELLEILPERVKLGD